MKRRGAVLAIAVLSGACDPEYGMLRIQEGAGDTDFATVSPRGVTLREGRVVVVFAEPISADPAREYEGLQRFELRVVDSDVALARRGVLRDSFVLSGAGVGLTQLEVLLDGRVQEALPLEVYEVVP